MSFAKLDSGIVNSTIWVLPHDVLRVWIWFLSQANAQGIVRTAAPALSHACMVPLDRIREILELLESPDPDSRSEVDEGRRIAKVTGGWQIINYLAYREARNAEARREQNRDAQARFREKTRKPESARVSQSKPNISTNKQNKPQSAQAEEEEEADKAKASELRSALAAPEKTHGPVPDTPPSEPLSDPIWGTGLAYLCRRRIPERQARSMLGKLRKAVGDIAAGALLAQAEAQDITDPAPWLMAAAGKRRTDGPQPVGKTMQAIQILERMKRECEGGDDATPRLAAS